MGAGETPLRCPKCDALVVDRRSPKCTTCHEALPEGWAFTPEQIAKIEMIDQHAKAEHAHAMQELDPMNDPTTRDSLPEIDPDTV